jgi:hypothetical protein
MVYFNQKEVPMRKETFMLSLYVVFNVTWFAILVFATWFAVKFILCPGIGFSPKDILAIAILVFVAKAPMIKIKDKERKGPPCRKIF